MCHHSAQLQVLDKTFTLLETDLTMLRQFINDDSVTDDYGDAHPAVREAAHYDLKSVKSGTTIERPVIRLMADGDQYETIFTRISPDAESTSMIIRVRAGWQKLKEELTRGVEAGAGALRRWDTYVCTAAEEPYALEVRQCRHAG